MNLANEHQVVVVHGPPGCGKTTQVIFVILPQNFNNECVFMYGNDM